MTALNGYEWGGTTQRLVQSGCRTTLLSVAGITISLSEMQARHLDEAFPHFVAHLELVLLSGELNPHHAAVNVINGREYIGV